MDGTMAEHAAKRRFKFVGERLCLDFVNTMSWRGAARPTELVADFGDLLGWAGEAGLLGGATARRLAAAARKEPAAAARALAKAVALREALHEIFAPAAAGDEGAAALGVLNRCLAKPRRLRLARGAGGYRWDGEGAAPFDFVLAPIAWSAAELLASPQAARVRRCEDEGCGWLFLDLSRNQRRRWCQMSSCGNRAKARRHYRRHRSAGAPA